MSKRKIVVDGITYQSVRDACKIYNIKEGTFKSRLNLGWSTSNALKTNLRLKENDFLNIYNQAKKENLSTKEITTKFGLKKGNYNTWRRKLKLDIINIPDKPKKYTKQIIINRFKKYLDSIDGLPNSLEFNKSKHRIGHGTLTTYFGGFENLARASGYKGDLYGRYAIDHNFFSKIDTEQKAYFIGLLITDGSIHSKRNTININLIDEDKHILHYFRDLLKTNHPIRFIDIKKHYPSRKNINIFEFRSEKIKSDLAKLSIAPKKTFETRLPLKFIDSKLHRHLIRGIFDGDGSIYLTGRFSITTGSPKFAKDLKEFFLKKLNLLGVIRGREGSSALEFYINIGKELKNTKSIYHYLYDETDKKCFLRRKYLKFKKIINN